jgi:predicted DNA-binding mobile mystery protein A
MNKHRLMIQHLAQKLQKFEVLKKATPPPKGWIHTLRTALNMSLRQLGERLHQSPQSIAALEKREQEGKITLAKMQEVAAALDMEFVYVLLPKGENLQSLVEKQAQKVAAQTIAQASQTMALEAQANSQERLQNAFEERVAELKQQIPNHLWNTI